MNYSPHSLRRAAILLAACSYISAAPSAFAAELFRLAGNSHGGLITGQPSAVVSQGAYAMTLTAGPAGALLNESHPQGLGVDSHLIAGVNDDAGTAGRSKMNLVGSPASGSIIGESVTFSFNRSGVIRDLLFDGVKDETLEFFRLESPDGSLRTFFDAEVVLRLAAQGFSVATLTEPGVTLLSDGNDDRLNVNIPFAPGEQFKLTYGEFPFPPNYIPAQNEAGNGARWEGLVVVPEPSAWLLSATSLAAFVGLTGSHGASPPSERGRRFNRRVDCRSV